VLGIIICVRESNPRQLNRLSIETHAHFQQELERYSLTMIHQERAFTSPIWYSPA